MAMSKQANFIFLVVLVTIVCSFSAFAASITPASGGSAIDNSTAGGTFTDLTGPVINESASSDIGNGTIILSAPAGFEFDTGASVTVLVTRTAGGGPPGKNINDVPDGTSLAVTSITSAEITFTVTDTTVAGGPGPAVTNSLTFESVRVRPTSGFPLASGDITLSGTSPIVGISGGASMGTLTEVGPPDTTPPVVTVPADITDVEATGPSGADVSFSASAVDDVDGNLTPVCTPSSGSTFSLGTTLVTCNATDAASNVGSASFNVTVVDTTIPDFSPDDLVVEAESSAGAVVPFNLTATDIVAVDIVPVCDATSGDTFPLGATTVNCTATDGFNNTALASFDITVEDTTPPDITAPVDVVDFATGALTNVSLGSPIVSDLVDPSPVVSNNAPVDGFPVGVTIVIWTATDSFGNNASANQSVTMSDSDAPVFSGVHLDMIVEANSSSGSVVDYAEPTATDAVDGNVSVVCDPASGSVFSLGNTTVSCSASDSEGNNASASFVVEVVDTTPPVITLIGSSSVSVTLGGSYVDAGASAFDDVDGNLTSNISVVNPVNTSVLGSYAVTYDVSDSAGNNASTVTRNVTVVSPPAPSGGGGGGGSGGGSSNNYQPYGTQLITSSAGVVPSVAPSTVPPAKSDVVPEPTPVPQLIPFVPPSVPVVPAVLTPQATGVFNLKNPIFWLALLLALVILGLLGCYAYKKSQ